jgi:virginiamycin B lyase
MTRPARQGLASIAACFLLALSSQALGAPRVGAAVVPSQPIGLQEGTHVSAMTTGPEGKLWFAGFHSGIQGDAHGVIGSVGLDGQVGEFPLPFEGPVEGIAVGPDGNLWFTNLKSGEIGRISPAGQLEQYHLPQGSGGPTAIIEGPEEAMWYSEPSVDAVGWFQTERIRNFSLAAGSKPDGLVVGPDHAVWVAETGTSRIARIVDGVPPQEFQLPNPAAQPEQIVVGPDNALWFTEAGVPAIGRITTDGKVTEFPVPGQAGTSQISHGPEGVLWYSNLEGGIGSITTAGETARPECPLHACQYSIATLTQGPDGQLWYGTGTYSPEGGGGARLMASYAGSLVGRFSPAPVEVEIGTHPSPVRGRKTTIPLRCEGGIAGTSCEGVVRLYRHRALLAVRSYSLQTGSARRVALRLSRRAMRELRREGHLRVRATASTGGGKADSRKLVLRPS